jgi:hypothetical protein
MHIPPPAMPALLGLWATVPRPRGAFLGGETLGHREPSHGSKCPCGIGNPVELRTSAGQSTQPPPMASRVTAKSHRKKEVPFWGNATHSLKIPGTLDRAKCRTPSEEEFVFELQNLEVPSTNLREIPQYPRLECGLDVVEQDRKLLALFELAELGREGLRGEMPRAVR